MATVFEHPKTAAGFRITAGVSEFERADLYSVAESFIQGRIDIQGDLFAAIRWKRDSARTSLRCRGLSSAVRWWPRVGPFLQTKGHAARNIRFHYDRSNDFFAKFLGANLVYSCAYFKEPDWPLDRAQEAKLDHICRKLNLAPGERFLDIGCGWGGLVLHAAERYGARATGCTLSIRQSEHARRAARERGLEELVSVHELDYRDLEGQYEKIASVGMFEHVGAHRLKTYFRKVRALVAAGGRFLNHGIARPKSVKRDAESLFLERRVFPGGELPSLAYVVRAAEETGFEVLDVENLRPHYALTCRAWVCRLQVYEEACTRIVGREAYRTWLLFLAASALAFEEGVTEIHQVLMARRDTPAGRRLTRDFMYSGADGVQAHNSISGLKSGF